MEIDAVDPHYTYAGQEADPAPDPTPPADEPSEPTPPADEPTVEQTSEDTETQGVLRNLLDGHYKGVSEVRLRINFFEELAAIEADQLQAVADENVDGVLEAVGAVVGTLAEEGEPPEDPAGEPTVESASESTPEVPAEVLGLQDKFADTVNELKDDFLAAEAPSTAALVDGMNSAFDEFVAALVLAMTPPPPDVTVEEPPPDDGGDEPADVEVVEEATPDDGGEEPADVEPVVEQGGEEPADVEPVVEQGGDEPADVEAVAEEGGAVTEPPAPSEPDPGLEAFIAELRAAFEAAMDEFTSAFGQVAVLAGLSEPTGNGVAYEKFLAIYNEMRGVGTTDAGEPAPEPLEAEG